MIEQEKAQAVDTRSEILNKKLSSADEELLNIVAERSQMFSTPE